MTTTYEPTEIISIEDYRPTNSPDVFVKDNGDTAIIIDPHHVMVIKTSK